MKKFSFISLVFLLVLQSFIGPLAASANANDATGQSFTASITVDEAGKATLKWGFKVGAVTGTEQTFSVQSDYKFDEVKTGVLSFGGKDIGTFTISVDGLITATIFADQVTDSSGAVEVTGVQLVAPVTPKSEEKPVDEVTKEKPADEKVTEGDKDEVLPPTSTPTAGVPREIPVKSMEFSLKIDGVELDKESAKTMELEQGKGAKINLIFNVDLSELYLAGDSFEFELPLSVLNFGNFDGTVLTATENPQFTYRTAGNKVTVTLKEDLIPEQTNSNYKVEMEFESKFSLSGDNLDQDIEIPKDNSLTNTETITLTFKPSTSNEKMSKTNKGFKIENGDRIIDWEIWVNEAGKLLTNATVADVPAVNRHEIVTGSVQVAKYDVGLNGVINKSGAGTTYLTNSNFSDINLNGNNAYKITYKTKVIAESPAGNQLFSNTATLTNGPTKETANGSQSITYGEALTKNKINGQTNNNYESNWEIKYNYNLAKISAPTGTKYNIKDTFPGPQNIDISSIKVFKMDAVNGTVAPGNGTLVPNTEYSIDPIKNADSDAGTDGFELKFKSDITDAYIITYKAKYENDIPGQNDFYTAKEGNLTNTVANGTINKEAGHYVYQGILTKDYTLDLNVQKLTWTITIKADNEAISNLEIQDLFSVGKQTLTGANPIGEITVVGMTGHSIVLEDNDPSKGFTLTGGNIAKGGTATITYTTDYEIQTAGVVAKAYTNTANASWKYNGNNYMVSESKTYTPTTTTVNNGSKSGTYDYDTQIFTWGIKVNFNKKDIQNAVLKDKLGPGHEIIDGSFIIYDFTPTGGDDTKGTIGTTEALVKDTDYSVVVNPDKKGFELTFATSLDSSKNNKAYYVEYKTKDSDKIIGISKEELEAAGKTEADKGNYTNEATLTQGATTHTLLSEPVKVKDTNQLVSKTISSSSSNEGTLTWTIDVNKSLSDIGEVTLTDVPSENLMLISDSIEIAVMSINAANGVTPGTTWVKPTNIELTVNSDGSFKLNLGDLSKKAVQVRYKTFVLGLKNEAFSNKATISYSFSDDTSENQKNEHEYKDDFKFSRSSAFSSADKGTVKLQKVGLDTITTVKEELPGVKFQLVKTIAGKEFVIKEVTSVGNGYFQFENIGYGDYVIKEDTTTTPAGYVGSANIKFKMGADTDILLAGNENLVVEVVNEKINQAVKLTKVDKADPSKKLSGAQFTLHLANGDLVDKDKDGNVIPDIITNAHGEIALNNLNEGSYYFEETVSPDNYVFGVSKKTGIFEIKAKQTTFTEVTMENERGVGKIVITKVDASNNSILIDGVEFELSKGGVLIDTQKTVNGIATFSNLPYDTYTLVETKAHTNYLLDPTEKTVVLDSETGINGEIKKLTIENSKTNRSVILTKYNSNKSLKLKGAIFELRKETASLDKDGNPIYDVVIGIDVEKLTTDDNGEISLKDLQVGKYQLIETKAPAGYKLDKTPVEFEIIEKQEKAVIVEKTNIRISTGGGGGFPEEPGTPPTDPNNPGTPGNPGDPNNPGTPGNPGDPNNPGTPGNPGNTNNPGTPGDPNNPGTPVDPNNPGTPGTTTPGNSGNTGNPGNPNNSGNTSSTGNPNNSGGTSSNGNPNNAGNVSNSGNPNALGANGTNLLPQTGDTYPVGTLFAGLASILLGLWIMFNRRKTTKV